MDLGLADKRVLVTGASRGIGLATARLFQAEGATVTSVARTASTLEAASREIGVSWVAMDCASPTDWARLAGSFDIVVANVGDGSSVPDPVPERSRFEQTWMQNFRVAEEAARFAAGGGVAGGGCLIFVSSIAGLEEIGAPTDYAVAKNAVMTLSKTLARKLAPSVRVNCVVPGNVRAPGGVWERKLEENPERVAGMLEREVPLGRFGTANEIAAAIAFLASELSSFTTGAALVVDGGQTRAFR